MANQDYQLKLRGPNGTKAVRVIAVDSDGGANTFTDFGGSTTWTADADYQILDAIGQGTTAPATATVVQVNANGTDRPLFLNLAAMFNASSKSEDRLGAAEGAVIPEGTTLQLISRS